MIASHCRLNSRIQRQQIRLIGNVFDQAHDLANFLRALAQALNLLGGFLHILADMHHAIDGLHHRLFALAGVAQRFQRGLGAHLRVARRTLNKGRQRLHCISCLGDLYRLLFRSLSQFGGAIQNAPRSRRHLQRRRLYLTHHLRQFFDHIVKRVRQHTQRVGGHLGLHPQVAITHRAHFL